MEDREALEKEKDELETKAAEFATKLKELETDLFKANSLVETGVKELLERETKNKE